jgi:hypothetical protein
MSKYAVMFFETELTLGMSTTPGKWHNTKTVYTDNGYEALNIYANTPCPASQLLKANTEEELEMQINEMKNNFKDEDWLNENLYPFL